VENIKYNSEQLVEYYRNNKFNYDDFYASEKIVFDKVFSKLNENPSVLDVGCACGGLGNGLSQKFNLKYYCGVDINSQCIAWAKRNNKLPIPHDYIEQDILNCNQLNKKKFDLVFNLSCADWNIKTLDIIEKSWELVDTGGYMIISLRLTENESLNDITKSFQFIDFSGSGLEEEKANYVIINFYDAYEIFSNLLPMPDYVYHYGFYGSPSLTATTPYDKLCFSVLAIRKGHAKSSDMRLEMDIPYNVMKA
jgi:SAM-dependent methyltransferase